MDHDTESSPESSSASAPLASASLRRPEMAARIDAFDWSSTALGSRQSWPAVLQSVVQLCLQSHLPMFVWWGPELINIYNDAYAPVLGKRHPDALGRPARQIWADIWNVIGDEVDDVVLRGKAIVKQRVRFVMERNGYPEETYFTYSHSPIVNEKGEIAGLFQVCFDETESVRAAAERDALAEQRQLALNAARLGWWHYDPRTRLVTYDKRHTEIFGFAGQQIANEKILEKIHPQDLPTIIERVQAALDPVDSKPYSARFRLVEDGKPIRWVEAHGAASFEGEGTARRAASFVGTVADVTAEVIASDRARTILESITDGFFALDANWIFTYVNPQAEKLLGRIPGDLLGKLLWEVYPGLIGSEIERVYRVVARTGKAESVTEFYPDHQRWYEVHTYPAPQGGVSIYFRDVSQRMLAEESLRESTSLLKGISDATDDAMFAKDRQGRLRFANPATLALIGKPLHDVVGKTDAEFLADPQVAAAVMANDQLVMETGASLEIEEVVPLADGTRRVWQSRKMPNVDASGQVVGLFGLSRDITGQKLAEQAIREIADKFEKQSRLFERIASSTPDFIYVFDLQGRFLYANRRLLEVWGTTADEAMGKGLIELGYPQWHADMHHRELEQVIQTRQPIRGEVPFTGGSGISGVYEYIFTPVLAPDGNVEVIAGTTRDITERKQAEARMNRDAMLLANVRDSVIVTDVRGIVTFWNEGATRLFGWTAEEMLNQPYAERFPEPVRAEVVAWIARVAKGSGESSGEWCDYRKDGSRVWIEGTTRLINDLESNTLGIMGVCRDITDRKSVEAQREALLESEKNAREQAEHASRMKDEFLATLSHELRTPLNAILGWASILASSNPSEEDLREGLETIQRNARAQTQIIEDLLDMSRIISGKVRLEVQRTDIAKVLESAIATVRPAADAKGVRLRSVLDPNTTPVTGDPNRLQQVFWNLLNNAVKFTPKGGQVQLLLERVNSHIEITVSDTGEGIAAEFLPHVFDRFRQADASTTRRHGGLGLGLAIVKQLVELHGGTVRVKSPGAGQGSTFVVALPLTVLHLEPEDAPVARRHPAAIADTEDDEKACLDLNGIRVLVVDDEPDARALVKRLLEDCDAVVRTAGSASEALTLIAAEVPDVLISDIGMPQQDGYALIRQIRSLPVNQGREIPAVALTAYARSEDRVRAMRAGFQMHVVKPVDASELITVVACLVQR